MTGEEQQIHDIVLELEWLTFCFNADLLSEAELRAATIEFACSQPQPVQTLAVIAAIAKLVHQANLDGRTCGPSELVSNLSIEELIGPLWKVEE